MQSLFYAASEAAADERARILADETVDPEIRAYVAQLLAASDRVGDRFETPAIASVADRSGTWEATPSLVGRRLGPYHVVRRIGQGGMGAVYEAERADGTVHQRVAVKTLWRGADSSVLARRFRTERQILAGLRHANIAQFLDAGALAEGTPYLVMEFVDGVPIDVHCDERGLGLAARLDLFLQVCAAVQHAHRNLVVHRDLKPSNVLVTADGAVKLLDFGVAKLLDDPRVEGTLTAAGLSPFTTAFAAPEQVSGNTASTATDVYALGALLTVLLAGRPPLDVGGLTTADAFEAIRAMPASAPSELAKRDAPEADAIARARGFPAPRQLARALRAELDAIALMALRKEPARRYATVDAFAEDVRRYLRREQVLARPDTIAYRVRAFVRRRRAVVAGSAIALGALLVGTGAALWQARQSRIAAEQSERIARFLARVMSQESAADDPIARLGPKGTVAQLLDSLVRRVPTAFADDEGIRARLYSSLGSSLITQGRMGEAQAVLDSAVLLAERAHGRRSDVFAAASLQMASVLLNRTVPTDPERHVRAALAALSGREQQSSELFARAVMALASVRQMQGHMREADSLARLVITIERARSPGPTMTRVYALGMLSLTTAWIIRDPRVVDSLEAHTIALADSLGAPLAFERLNAMDGRANALSTLGRYALADSLVAAGLDLARVGYGPRSRETGLLLSRRSLLRRALGDTAQATLFADSAWSIVNGLSDVAAPYVFLAGSAKITDAWAHGRFASADSLAERLLARVVPQRVPLATTAAAQTAGLAALYVKNWPRAEARFRVGIDALPGSGDLDSMLDRLREPLAQAIAEQGRKQEADSIRALIAPKVDGGRCRPGGDWRGC